MEIEFHQTELFEQIVCGLMPEYHRTYPTDLPAPALDRLRVVEASPNSSDTIIKVLTLRNARASRLASELIQRTGLHNQPLSPTEVAENIDAMREMHDEQYATYDSAVRKV